MALPPNSPQTGFLQNLMVRHKQLLHTLFSLVFINLVIAGLGLVTRVSIANLIGIESFGKLAFGLAVGTFGLLFVQFGLEKSLVRDLVHLPARFGEIVEASLLVRAILFLAFMAGLIVSAVFFVETNSDTIGISLIILATVASAFSLGGVYDAWKEMRRHAVYYLVQRLTYFTLIWLVIFIPDWDLSLSQIGMFLMVGVIASLLFEFRWAWPRIDFKRKQGLWPSTLFIVHSNIWIWVAVLTGHTVVYLSQIFLKFFSGNVELGGYSAAWLVIQLAILLHSQIGRIGSEATARYTRTDTPASKRMWFYIRYNSVMAGLGLMIGLPCVLFPEVIIKIYSPEYANAAETLRILGFYPIFFGPYMAALQYFISCRLQKSYVASILFVGAISLGLNLWLIPLKQSEGAALSVVISAAITAIVFSTISVLHIRNLPDSTSAK